MTITNYSKFTSQALDAKIKQNGLVDKSVISGSINNDDLDKKKISNKKQIKSRTEQNNKIRSIR